MTRIVGPLFLASTLFASAVQAQTLFGANCAGASGVRPKIAATGIVKSGHNWTLEVTAPGGIGFGYLLIGFSNTTASTLGGLPLPIELGVYFADPRWAECALNVDPSYAMVPYAFDPNSNGGRATFTFPGFDVGTVYVQAVNIDTDFVTRIAGVSNGVAVRPPPAGMVLIEPGTFQMGSNAPGGAPYVDGKNADVVHTVTISYPFWMGTHEVTQTEYQAVMLSNPSEFLGAHRPVERVSWYHARLYCALLTAAETLAGNIPADYEYRLPSEAEWEYACRAGTTTEFNVGTDLLCADARFASTYHPTLTLTSCGNPQGTVDVGGYAPNAWGLCDMHGNVLEWCLDAYVWYSGATVTDPFITEIDVPPNDPWWTYKPRVLRGGRWYSSSNQCRSAERYPDTPNSTGYSYGFRVVLGPVFFP